LRAACLFRSAGKHGNYACDADRDRCILTRSLRRSILCRYLRTKPGELKFAYGKHGKPELSNGVLRFNTSHSSGLMVCAVSRSCDVGIDVERIRAGVEESVAGWFFSLRALRYLENLPEPLRTQRFFHGWTRMEAYGKALGAGLAKTLKTWRRCSMLQRPGSYARGALARKTPIAAFRIFSLVEATRLRWRPAEANANSNTAHGRRAT